MPVNKNSRGSPTPTRCSTVCGGITSQDTNISAPCMEKISPIFFCTFVILRSLPPGLFVGALNMSQLKHNDANDIGFNAAATSISEVTHVVSKISEMNIQITNAAEEQSTVAEEINRKIVSISIISHQASDDA